MNRRDEDPTMHTDDQVAPRTTRSRALVLVAFGLLLFGLAAASLFVTVGRSVDHAQNKATLNASDIAAIRQLISDRKTERDQEQTDVQARLDEQTKVLCLMISDFGTGASGRGEATLDKGWQDLKCAHLLPALPAP